MSALLIILIIASTPVYSQLAETKPPDISSSQAPSSLIGKWYGEARHGDEIAELGMVFEKQDNGRVLTREWLPNLNAYGSAVGFVISKGGKFVLPKVRLEFVQKENELIGSVPDQGIMFKLSPTNRPLPSEPQPPSLSNGPEPVWTYHGNGEFWGSPIVEQDIVFLGDASGTFQAVDAENGRAKWTFDAGSKLFGAAAVDRDGVYFATDNGDLIKLRKDTGTEIWRANIGGAGIERGPYDSQTAAPVVDGSRVYIGSADGTFRALECKTDKPIWSFKTNDKIRGAALLANNRVYFGGLDHFVYALDQATGKEIWRFDTGSSVTTAPVLADNKLAIGTRDRALLFALDAAKGTPKWNVYFWYSFVESAPTLVDGMLYIGSSDSRRVRAIDPRTGHVAWTSQVWGVSWGTPLVVGDTIYYATAGIRDYFINHIGSLGALDRKTGVIKWRKPFPSASKNSVSGYANSLICSDGKIIAAGLDGTIIALPTK